MIVNTPNPDDSDLVADSGDRMLHKARSTLRGIAPYARRRRGLFLKGALAAIGIVAARLALPWPLREIARLASDGGGLSGLSLSMNGEIMRLSHVSWLHSHTWLSGLHGEVVFQSFLDIDHKRPSPSSL